MIPIRDENPTYSTPHVTIAFIVLNVLVFLAEVIQPGPAGMDNFIWKYGYVPAELQHGRDGLVELMRRQEGPATIFRDRWGRIFEEPGQRMPIKDATAYPAWLNIFTCMFLHGGWMHLIGNMLYLWIFGNNIEERLGPVLFVVFYLCAGLVGNLVHTVFESGPGVVPLVGASGAISGIMGAYILLFPHTRVLTVIPLGFYWFTARVPAWLFLGIYIVLQNLSPALRGSQDSVAYWAHIGGFGAGMALIVLLPRRPVYPPPPHAVRNRILDDRDVDFDL